MHRASFIVPPGEVEFTAIRAQGAGGQNINKVSCAAHLRFDIRRSSLPETLRERLLGLDDRRVSSDGVIVIKAQQFRSLEKNRHEALQRLQEMIDRVAHTARPRKATRPSHGSVVRRLEEKTRRAAVKRGRGRPDD